MSVQAIAFVLEHSDAQGADRLALLAVANHAGSLITDDTTGISYFEAYPGIDVIAWEARFDNERTAQNALTRLVKAGEIERVINGAPDHRIPGGKKPNLYRIIATPRPLRRQIGQRFEPEAIARHPCMPLAPASVRRDKAAEATRLAHRDHSNGAVDKSPGRVSSHDTPTPRGVSSDDAQGCRPRARRGVVSRRAGVSSDDTQTVIEPSIEPSEEPRPNVPRAELPAGLAVDNPRPNGTGSEEPELPLADRLAQRAATVVHRMPPGHEPNPEGTRR